MEHEAGTESGGAPISDMLIYSLRSFKECFAAASVKAAIMMKVVNSYLESSAGQFLTKILGDSVLPFRNEVKRGAETVSFFEVSQLGTFIKP